MNPPNSNSPRGGLDPTFDVDAAPRVGGNSSLWPLTFGVLGALALGTVVFLQLSANQRPPPEPEPQPVVAAVQPTPAPVEPFYPPPPEPEPAPEPLIDVQPAPPLLPPGPTQAELDRLRAPALVIDLGEYRAPAPGAPTPAGTPGAQGAALDAAGILGTVTGAANAGAATTSQSPNERFAERFGGLGGASTKPTSAKRMGDLSTTIIEGSVIPAVLETALNSDAPGFVRGVVTRDVRGFDGSKVLVPRGSRLIGEYNSGTALGQSRAFVIWTRLIRPDGATIDLASPAADGLGQGGIGGKVDTHFLQRFGGAILLSLLNIGASAVSDSADTTIVLAGARAGADAASSTLGSQSESIGPTITVLQGTPVRVFVSQDLDFSAVGPVKPADEGN